jgi:catechol 2,3-dioxygenase-like lactoylglutathione lyase family enzyme
VDYKLELIVIPVTDMDRAKAFYGERVGFHVDVDHRAGEDFRVIQLTPPGSACSITLMRNAERAGAVQGLHLVVQDIEAAQADLASRGVEISEPFHFGPQGQTPGLDPDRRAYGSFASFNDPDGNGWLLQEVKR